MKVFALEVLEVLLSIYICSIQSYYITLLTLTCDIMDVFNQWPIPVENTSERQRLLVANGFMQQFNSGPMLA